MARQARAGKIEADKYGRPIKTHGIINSYSRGCRCEECVKANHDYYIMRNSNPEYVERRRKWNRDAQRNRRGSDPSRYRSDKKPAQKSIEEGRATLCPGCAKAYTFRVSGFCAKCENEYMIGA